MSWAKSYVEQLQRGETVEFRPQGRSMQGLIGSGQLCTVAPIRGPLQKGDIVLCTVKGHHYLHKIYAINIERAEYLIGNAKGHINGWVPFRALHGKLISLGNIAVEETTTS